ncbi:MAG: DNA-processing protein DprA [Candidatus Auribacterota bacterium]|nr:DNA-processing protein DprA [Candidatus Auribacterota bacterium]
MNSKDALIILNALFGIGPVKVNEILKHYPDPSVIFENQDILRSKVKSIHKKDILTIKDWQRFFDIEKEKDICLKRGIDIVTVLDEQYPGSLREIIAAPPVLYVKGRKECFENISIAIVGARRASSYGRSIAYKIGYDTAAAGFNVVSGLAKGVDISAHEGALAAGGLTTAVIGSGFLNVYPGENIKVAEKICKKGLLISEFNLDEKPCAGNFPRRNRIISALSQRILVVEASVKSGSLITVNYALEQGKDVYAVPGRIDSQFSKGVNKLIKDGAFPVLDSSDLLFGLV